jgi:hypothetical protein
MATNFLWYTGATAGTGLLAPVVSVLTTELNALTTSSVVASTAGGSSGLFTNASVGQGIWAEAFFVNGTQTATVSSGGNIAGWFLTTPDAGTTVESKSVVPPRPPDFLIPMVTAATGAVFKAAGLVRLPALEFYVLAQNNTGVTISTSGNIVKVAPVAVQY